MFKRWREVIRLKRALRRTCRELDELRAENAGLRASALRDHRISVERERLLVDRILVSAKQKPITDDAIARVENVRQDQAKAEIAALDSYLLAKRNELYADADAAGIPFERAESDANRLIKEWTAEFHGLLSQ